jgi:hypothetical protein
MCSSYFSLFFTHDVSCCCYCYPPPAQTFASSLLFPVELVLCAIFLATARYMPRQGGESRAGAVTMVTTFQR